jgi:hypothetical protein
MEHNRSFDEAKGYQTGWDATSVDLAATCLRKYYYTMVRQIKPKTQSVHLIFGGIYASALESFYKKRALGASYETALREVVHEALIASWDSERGAPVPFEDDKKTRPNLIRTIIWYLEEFGNEDPSGLVTYHLRDGTPAVELSFTFELADDILYCGHLDRVSQMGDHLYVVDQKAQPLNSQVLGYTGWTTIGQLKLGDLVATQSGEFVPVIGLYPKGVTKVYRVHFNDKSYADCAEDHLWRVATQFSDVFRTVNFSEILNKKPYVKYHVPLPKPIQHPKADLPLDPYLLGVLLGDGYLNGNSIQLSSTKDWLVNRVKTKLPNGDKIKKASRFNNSWTISGGATLGAIRKLRLKGKLAYDKFVPDLYLFASEEQRRALLEGLLDTDGGWDGKHRIFDSTSFRLIDAVKSLVRSLGGTARSRDRGDGAWRIRIRMPDLPTGVGRRYITGVERLPDAETMCIKVDHPSGLYITDNHVVTHNTTGGTVGQYFFDRYSPDNQMSGYAYAGKVVLGAPIAGVIIDAAQIAINFSRFERRPVTRSKAQLSEWRENALHHIRVAQSATALQKFPMNTTACNNYGGCPFKPLCARDPSVRENYIKSDYVEHIWDPLKAR